MWIVKRKKSNKKKKKGNSSNSVYFFQDMTGDCTFVRLSSLPFHLSR